MYVCVKRLFSRIYVKKMLVYIYIFVAVFSNIYRDGQLGIIFSVLLHKSPIPFLNSIEKQFDPFFKLV